MDDFKKRIQASVLKYAEKNSPLPKEPRRKNKKPEEETKDDILRWCRIQNWFMTVVESKAMYSVQAGIYKGTQTKKGTSDLIGCTNTGLAAFIEVKAPGKRSTLKPHQREFLVQAIARGAFACVSDGPKHLESLALAFLKASSMERKRVLLRDLGGKGQLPQTTDRRLFELEEH